MNAPAFRLIAATADPDAAVAAFEDLATEIQSRDDTDRVSALRRAISERPDLYAEYFRAMPVPL